MYRRIAQHRQQQQRHHRRRHQRCVQRSYNTFHGIHKRSATEYPRSTGQPPPTIRDMAATCSATATISGLAAALLICTARLTLCCRISEFMCKSTGGCVRLDEYCDGKYDCPDRSDEPPSCTGTAYTSIYYYYNVL